MAQKKFPVLHKIDTSMTWYSTIYNKNYKWLSSNYLFILNLIFKVKFLINNFNFFWNKKQNILNINFNRNNYKFLVTHKFENKNFINLNTYLIDFELFILVLNLYLQTDFFFLKKKKKKKKFLIKNIFKFDKFLNNKIDLDENIIIFQRKFNKINFNKNLKEDKYIINKSINISKNTINTNNLNYWLINN